MQMSQVVMSYTQPNFDQTRYLSQFYEKCLILCRKIQLKINVLHDISSIGLLPWQHIGFQTSPILKAFLVIFANGA